jgi:predicted ArsR family transcriptional regulator
MTKLNDTQLVLLATAAQRDDGMLLPISSAVAVSADRVRKMISALISKGLALEASVPSSSLAMRSDGDEHFGAAITDAGRAAIGVASASWIKAAAPAVQREVKRTTKSDTVVTMLEREEGATLAEIMEATGWLPHTTRAALTGLRKKGHTIDKFKREDVTCYQIVAAA